MDAEWASREMVVTRRVRIWVSATGVSVICAVAAKIAVLP